MKKIILFSAFFLISACGKKETATTVSPQPPVTPQASTSQAATPQPSYDESFTIPTPPKKQAKYFPEGTPSRAIQDLDDMLDSYITSPKTPEDEAYNANLKRAVIHGTFDIRELCRVALDKHWNEIQENDQKYFVDLMLRLLQRKAIFSKEQGQKKKTGKNLYQITYVGDEFLSPDKATALAKSKVFIPSQNLNITLNYKLKKEEAGWRIFDIVVDGASLVDNYKYQFDKIIGKEGYPGLVKRMETKLQDLEKKSAGQTEPVQ